MKNLKLAHKNKEVDPKSWQTYQESIIEPQIRDGDTENPVGYSSNQEYAMLRKAVKHMYSILVQRIPEIALSKEYSEFMEYCNRVEKVTESFKQGIKIID